ncbi:MAG: D-amino-acid transaminase [Alphaproteobacteria bacterium]|nr:D-amino-acid transaminase [Alphaproteobacteria bacterium]
MRVSYVNGSYEHHAEAAVHIEDRGYQFADAIYEYIAFYNGKLLDGDLHLKRLERSLKALDIAMPMSLPSMQIVIRELIARNARADGGLYIQVSRGVAPRNHPFPKHTRPSLVMTICGAKTPSNYDFDNGVKVITQPDIRWGRCDVKSVGLLPNVLAKQEAMKKHVRDAWLVQADNQVTETSAANAYIVTKDGTLVTHHADEHILGGVSRDVLLKLARKNGITVEERSFNLMEAKAAAEAFMTSTSINVLPVVKIDDTLVNKGRVGEVTKKLQALYNAHIFKQTGKQL